MYQNDAIVGIENVNDALNSFNPKTDSVYVGWIISLCANKTNDMETVADWYGEMLREAENYGFDIPQVIRGSHYESKFGKFSDEEVALGVMKFVQGSYNKFIDVMVDAFGDLEDERVTALCSAVNKFNLDNNDNYKELEDSASSEKFTFEYFAF